MLPITPVFGTPDKGRPLLKDLCIVSVSSFGEPTFLHYIREPRYKQNNIGYQISRVLNNKQSNILKSDTATIHKFSGYEHSRSVGYITFKGGFPQHVLGANRFLFNIRELKYKQNKIRHKIQRSTRVSMESWYRNLLPSLDWSRSRHPLNFPVSMSLSLNIKEILQSQ